MRRCLTRFWASFIGVSVISSVAHASLENPICTVITLSNDARIYVAGNPQVGMLRVLHKQEYLTLAQTGQIKPSDIIVIDEYPPEGPSVPTKAIISGNPIRKSHMNDLAFAAGTPMFYSKDIHLDPVWSHISPEELTSVHLDEDDETLRVSSPLSASDASRIASEFKKTIATVPPKKSIGEVIPFQEMGAAHSPFVGEKAFSLWKGLDFSEQVSGIDSNKQFAAITNGHYFEYIEAAIGNAGVPLTAMLSELSRTAGSSHPEPYKQILERIHTIFENYDLSKSQLNRIHDGLTKIYGKLDRPYRFRSSANVESAIGAGVYDSVVIDFAPGQTHEEQLALISGGARRVWASLFSNRAYQIRRVFNMHEDHLSMAILVRPSVDDGLRMTGIAEVRNYDDRLSVTIDVYEGSEIATNSSTAAKHESASTYGLLLAHYIEDSRHFKDHDGETFLKFSDIVKLNEALHRSYQLHRSHDRGARQGDDITLGFEFLIGRDGVVDIVDIKEKERRNSGNASYLFKDPEMQERYSMSKSSRPFQKELPRSHTRLIDYLVAIGSLGLNTNGLNSIPLVVFEFAGKPGVLFGVDHEFGIPTVQGMHVETKEAPAKITNLLRVQLEVVAANDHFMVTNMIIYSNRFGPWYPRALAPFLDPERRQGYLPISKQEFAEFILSFETPEILEIANDARIVLEKTDRLSAIEGAPSRHGGEVTVKVSDLREWLGK